METNYIYPDESPRDGCLSIVAMTLAFILALLMCVLMGSCRSIKYVPVKEEIHDTVKINKTDTVNHYEVKKEKELVYVKDSTSTVLDEQGNVKSKEKYLYTTIIKEKSDSLNIYKAKYDSLLSVKQEVKEVPVIVEKPLSKMDKWLMSVGKVSLGVYVGLLLAAVLYVIWRIYRPKGGDV